MRDNERKEKSSEWSKSKFVGATGGLSSEFVRADKEKKEKKKIVKGDEVTDVIFFERKKCASISNLVITTVSEDSEEGIKTEKERGLEKTS